MKTKAMPIMMNRVFLFLGLIGLAANLFFLPPAFAHRVGIPVTTFEWHAPDKVWHVVHRLSVHDFGPAIEGLALDDPETVEGQTLIGRYVLERFLIAGQSDALQLSYLGAEEDADSFYVYFQIATPDQTIAIENGLGLVGDRDERRHALVNMNNGKETSTLLFTAQSGPKLLDLSRPET